MFCVCGRVCVYGVCRVSVICACVCIVVCVNFVSVFCVCYVFACLCVFDVRVCDCVFMWEIGSTNLEIWIVMFSLNHFSLTCLVLEIM